MRGGPRSLSSKDQIASRNCALLCVAVDLELPLMLSITPQMCFVGMYRHSPRPVRLWNINNNTLAGDAVVTIFVEVLVAWLIVGALVTNDVRYSLVTPGCLSLVCEDDEALAWLPCTKLSLP